MRPSTVFMLAMAAGSALFLTMGLFAWNGQALRRSEQLERVRLARQLRLTDLCLFTEARYTRHPAMADLHAPFQDHPTAFEHFPSGSLVTPPPTLQRPPHAPNP